MGSRSERPCEAVQGRIGRPKWEAEVRGRARPKWEAVRGRSGRSCEAEVGGRVRQCEAEVGGRGRPNWEAV